MSFERVYGVYCQLAELPEKRAKIDLAIPNGGVVVVYPMVVVKMQLENMGVHSLYPFADALLREQFTVANVKA